MTQFASERAKRNDEFGRLLSGAINSIATYEGKSSPIVEDELGQKIGLSGASIQRYKRGHVPPEARTIQILAEAAIKRGYLNRRWLTRFLHTAGYASPDHLINDLCPVTLLERADNERVLHNLPPPNYSQFIMRPGPFDDLLEALQQRTAAVVVTSLGGMGKTSLVREVASLCLKPGNDHPTFDAAVWISDAERPGFTSLNSVLDEVARTLGYEGLVDRNEEDKRRSVEQLLRNQRVLLIMDNFETVNDGALLRWLLQLPEPSKAIITTREYRRDYRQGAWPVELRGMTEAESRLLVAQRLRMLRLDTLAHDTEKQDQIVRITGGNPKAIEMVAGNLKYSRRAFRDVIDDFEAARGNLFELLFSHNWSLLDEAARRVLLAATFFSPDAHSDALAATADVRNSAYHRGIEQLADLSLLDVRQDQPAEPVRYALHPLVRAFAVAELQRDPGFETAARARWLDWFVQIASEVGYSRNDLARLTKLDPERDMLHAVADWARANQRWDKLLALVQGCGFYCYVRGLLNRSPNINLLAARAAQQLGQADEELRWLAYHVQRAARIGNLSESERHLPKLDQLQTSATDAESLEVSQHAKASFYFAAGRYAQAEQEWRTLLANAQPDAPARLITVKWLATCLEIEQRYEDAERMLIATLTNAPNSENPRAIVALELALARVQLALGRDRNDIEANTQRIRATISAKSIERHVPDLLFLEGRLAELDDDPDRARQCFEGALEGFRRLGLQRELEETLSARQRMRADH